MRYDKHPEEVLIEGVVKTTIQIPYDMGLFDNYDNADEDLREYILIERRVSDLEQLNDDVIERFSS